MLSDPPPSPRCTRAVATTATRLNLCSVANREEAARFIVLLPGRLCGRAAGGAAALRRRRAASRVLPRAACGNLRAALLRHRASRCQPAPPPQPRSGKKERRRDAAPLSKLYDELVLKHGYEPAFVASSPLGAHAAAPSPPAGAAALLGAGLSAPPEVVALSEHLHAAARGAAVETRRSRHRAGRAGQALGLAAVEKACTLKQLHDAWRAGDATRDADLTTPSPPNSPPRCRCRVAHHRRRAGAPPARCARAPPSLKLRKHYR